MSGAKVMGWPDAMKLKPNSAQEIRDTETVQGKRKRLNEYAYRGGNPMVRAIMDQAHFSGLSGEDMMTWMAYEALLHVEHLQGILLEQAMLSPHTPMLKPESKP